MSDHEHFPAGSQGLFGVWQESALDDCVRRNCAVRDVLVHARKRVRATARRLVRQRAGRVHTGWRTVAHFETYTGVYERPVEEHRCSAYGSAAVVSRPQCPRLVTGFGESSSAACSRALRSGAAILSTTDALSWLILQRKPWHRQA